MYVYIYPFFFFIFFSSMAYHWIVTIIPWAHVSSFCIWISGPIESPIRLSQVFWLETVYFHFWTLVNVILAKFCPKHKVNIFRPFKFLEILQFQFSFCVDFRNVWSRCFVDLYVCFHFQMQVFFFWFCNYFPFLSHFNQRNILSYLHFLERIEVAFWLLIWSWI